MSISLTKYGDLPSLLAHEKTWLWIIVYENGRKSHYNGTHRHWAYVIGTKPNVLQRKGIRFNVWKCHDLKLDPHVKFEKYEDEIFEPEGALSSYGDCLTKTFFWYFQLAEIKDEKALRLHLLAHAIPEVQITSTWTCYDWMRVIFNGLVTDRAISLVRSPKSGKEITRFEEIEAEYIVPNSRNSLDIVGIQAKTSPGTQVSADIVVSQAVTSQHTGILEDLRARLGRR